MSSYLDVCSEYAFNDKYTEKQTNSSESDDYANYDDLEVAYRREEVNSNTFIHEFDSLCFRYLFKILMCNKYCTIFFHFIICYYCTLLGSIWIYSYCFFLIYIYVCIYIFHVIGIIKTVLGNFLQYCESLILSSLIIVFFCYNKL